MKNKKLKIISFSIITLLIIVGIIIFTRKSSDNEILIGNSENYYFAITNPSTEESNNFKNYTLIRKNKSNNKKEEIQLQDLNTNINLDWNSGKSFNNWILVQTLNRTNLYVVNVESGTVEELLPIMSSEGIDRSILNYSINNNKLIYTSLLNGKTEVKIMDMLTKEEVSLASFDSSLEIPVSIFEKYAAILYNNSILIYDIENNELIASSEALYSQNLFIFNNKIYTYKYENGNLVELDLTFKEKTLLETTNLSNNIYNDGNNIIFDNYFYNQDNETLYISSIFKKSQCKRLLLDDYIYTYNDKYEKMKEDSNYYKYTLKGDASITLEKRISKDKSINLLTTGEIYIRDCNSNKILNSSQGFSFNNDAILWDFAYSNNSAYSFKKSQESVINLVAINLEDSSEKIIKTMDGTLQIINIESYKDTVAYLYKDSNSNENHFVILNPETLEEKDLILENKNDIDQVIYNDKYIVTIDSLDHKIKVFGAFTGNILAISDNSTYGLYEINDNGFLASLEDSNYIFYDFNLKEVKKFNDYDKAIEYIFQ